MSLEDDKLQMSKSIDGTLFSIYSRKKWICQETKQTFYCLYPLRFCINTWNHLICLAIVWQKYFVLYAPLQINIV